ncbi:MAG: HAMP domain-containing protein [Lachnospiraceae bacterium]
MKLKFGLRARFILIFLVFSVLISLVAGYITQNEYSGTIEERYKKNAIETANLAASFIDGDRFDEYVETLEKDAAYEETQAALNRIRRNNKVEYLYALKVVSDTETVYVFDTWAEDTPPEEIGQLGGREAYNPDYTGIANALESGKTNEEFEVTEITRFGYNASIYAPILNSSGEAVGVVGVDVAMDDIKTTVDGAVKSLLTAMISIITLCFLALLLVVQGSFIRPIRVLKSCVEEMADGKLGVQAPVKGNNEISEISRIFNQMSFNIGIHMKEITDLNDGYHKFVPVEVFKILQKTDIGQIRLGDYKETDLSVLCMQVNDFESITRTMETKKLFAFINRIYQETVPAIQKRGGVIGEYYQGGFTAFYQTSCQDVLDSAIIVCQHLNELSKAGETGEAEAQIAFGISHGPVMLGIVGNDDRLATSMLSGQITMAEHLRSVGEKYRSRILITGTAAEHIPDFETQYKSRLVGIMNLKLSGRKERIYDVYNGDPDSDRELKDLTKEKFEEGVKNFLAGEFYQARLCFIEVLKLYRYDYAAREYLYLCNQYYQMEDGAEDICTYIEEC